MDAVTPGVTLPGDVPPAWSSAFMPNIDQRSGLFESYWTVYIAVATMSFGFGTLMCVRARLSVRPEAPFG
jgi:hypothetical protein